MDQRLKQQQQQAMMQQAMLLQQQQLYLSQMEPVPSGNLPPGFDTSTCRSVYVGNIHPNVTETLLVEVFQAAGPLEACKLIRKEKVQACFGYKASRQTWERVTIRYDKFVENFWKIRI